MSVSVIFLRSVNRWSRYLSPGNPVGSWHAVGGSTIWLFVFRKPVEPGGIFVFSGKVGFRQELN
jgi:hypothetical protein